ncbi:L,D-transpeptidase [Elizabethkingia sp. JS20170427COW]|uniref:L,D-transpeptidase n=1 Tax=Elizabethkingia sp. JS20170427COW TaxID=2583851 RepID=UPI001110016E|nr:L,D-transpeptidase [Elizabethkingia sp. JS20170427COW]QCX53830.1 L,D-transpeptidase [Elizabethkingia sp. JS20170427COW]
MMKNYYLGVIILTFVACNKEPISVSSNQEDTMVNVGELREDSLETPMQDTLKDLPAKKVHVILKTNSSYTLWPIKDQDSLKKVFLKEYSGETLRNILALNRVDLNNLWRVDSLIVPNTIEPNFLSYSPFPQYSPMLKEVRKIAFFSYPIQAYALYENGNLVKWGPTSMGSKSHQTIRGLHFTNWKGKEIISTFNDEWKLKWNFNIENHQGIGWHQYSMPGYPASHSCLRLLEDDAKWMYNWGEQWVLNPGGNSIKAKGTPVIIYGDYPWGKRRPWKNLFENPHANDVSEEDLEKIVAPYLDSILKEQYNREVVLQDLQRKKDSIKRLNQELDTLP